MPNSAKSYRQRSVNPLSAGNETTFQEPYLRAVLGFVGSTDIDLLYLEWAPMDGTRTCQG